ncbi:hypothetical protein REPUB_Repub09cG0016900 [Reevesia pubescens]
MRLLKGKSLLTSILKIAWNAVIYSIWCERNRRIFQHRPRTVQVIVQQVKDIVRLRLTELNPVAADTVNVNLVQLWNLDSHILS